MKQLIFYATLILIAVIARGDTPPPNTVKAKTFTGDGLTGITATGTSLNVNVTNSGGGSTVNQGNAGSQSWLVDVTNTVPVTGTFFQSTQPISGSVSVSNFPATQPISGSVSVSNFPSTQAVTGTFFQSTQPVSASSLPLPTGASTSSLQTTGNTSLASIDTKLNSLGQKTSVNSMPVVIASDQSAIPVSGTITTSPNVNVHDGSGTTINSTSNALNVDVTNTVPVTGTFFQSTQPVSATSLPLPTGAATSALQTTGNTALSTINTTLGTPFQAGGSIGNTSFIATQGTGTNLHVVVDSAPTTAVTGTFFQATQPVSGTVSATQSGTWTTTNAVNTNGSVSNSTAIGSSGVVTFSPPTHAVGFVIEAESSNTVNLRYACGTSASTTVGLLLEPGRDSGYINSACTVTVEAVSSTSQAAGILWVLSQ